MQRARGPPGRARTARLRPDLLARPPHPSDRGRAQRGTSPHPCRDAFNINVIADTAHHRIIHAGCGRLRRRSFAGGPRWTFERRLRSGSGPSRAVSAGRVIGLMFLSDDSRSVLNYET